MTHYNSWNKRKLPNLIITWTPIFLIRRVRHISLAPLKYSPLTPSTDVIYKIVDSDIASKSTDTDSHLIDSLMTQSWKLRVPTFFFPNFGVNTCPQFLDKNDFISKFLFICYPCCNRSFQNKRMAHDFSCQSLYNTPTILFLIRSACLLSPSFSNKLQQPKLPPPKS